MKSKPVNLKPLDVFSREKAPYEYNWVFSLWYKHTVDMTMWLRTTFLQPCGSGLSPTAQYLVKVSSTYSLRLTNTLSEFGRQKLCRSLS